MLSGLNLALWVEVRGQVTDSDFLGYRYLREGIFFPLPYSLCACVCVSEWVSESVWLCICVKGGVGRPISISLFSLKESGNLVRKRLQMDKALTSNFTIKQQRDEFTTALLPSQPCNASQQNQTTAPPLAKTTHCSPSKQTPSRQRVILTPLRA